MTLNSVLRRGNDHYVFLSKWYENPQFGFSPTSNLYDWSIEGATVVISNGDSTYIAEEILSDTVTTSTEWGFHMNYTSYYHFTTASTAISHGDTWSIEATHPDHDTLSAQTTIPGIIEFTDSLPDTLDASMDSLIFEWGEVANALGYLPVIYIYGYYPDHHVYKSLSYRTIEDGRRYLEHEPSTSRTTAYELADLFGQIRHLPTNNPAWWADYRDIYEFFFIFGVTAMDEALYYTVAVADNQDDLSSFSAPLQQFSNVVNGGGIFGSRWITYRKKVIIPRERVLEAMQ